MLRTLAPLFLLVLLLTVAPACGDAVPTPTPTPVPTPTPPYADYREAVDEYVLWCDGDEYDAMLLEIKESDITTYGDLVAATEIRLDAVTSYNPPALLRDYHDAYARNMAVSLDAYRQEPPTALVTLSAIEAYAATNEQFLQAHNEFMSIAESLPVDLFEELVQCKSARGLTDS